jgi:hypothetical protein
MMPTMSTAPTPRLNADPLDRVADTRVLGSLSVEVADA